MRACGGTEATITVLVPTRDRPEDLERLLGSMTNQTISEFELLVIDQSDATERTRTIIDGFSDARFVHVVDPHRGKSRALNLGIRMTSTSLIAFTDDDCEVPPTWLELGAESLGDRHDVGLVFGQVVGYPHDPSEQFVPALTFDSDVTYRGPLWRSHGLIGIGANIFGLRSAIEAIGLFDEDLGPGGVLRTGEDVELTYRMLRHGYGVARDVELSVVHYSGRAVADGTARTHWIDGGYAEAAGYGKHLRTRDVRALAVVGHELGRRGGTVVRQAIRRQRPLHIRTLQGYLSGLLAGWRSGPNWCRPDAGPVAR